MPSVSVLYIEDEVVAPHLELLRNICEPSSRSRPHVTVRYFDRLAVPEEHEQTQLSSIDLIEPGSFGLNDNKSSNYTVYIRCDSFELLMVEYKPHYSTTQFHITLYDGQSAAFASRLLEICRKFEWGYRVLLPHPARLKVLNIETRRKRKPPASRVYSSVLRDIFEQATSHTLTWDFVLGLSETERLGFAEKILEHLDRATANLPRVSRGQNVGPSYRVHPSGHGAIDPEVHLTPPELAKDVAEYALSLMAPGKEGIDFGDPAVGTGAFYAALLQVAPRERIASAIGIDISDEQMRAADQRWASRGLQLIHGDYLHMERLPPRSLILANPPYLRHQGISPEYKFGLRERASVVTGVEVSGRSGLYVYFMLLSHAWMADNAVAVWLIPSEFMQTAYGAALRHYLTTQVELIRIHKFSHDHPQFENAKVLPAVVAFRKVLPDPQAGVHLSSGGTLQNPREQEFVTVSELRHRRKWLIPQPVPLQLLSRIRLGDIFTVRRGIATGANDFFILEREIAKRIGIPDFAVRPILPKARAISADIIERDTDGYPRLSPQLCVVDCNLSEQEIETKYPKFAAYLNSAASRIVRDRALVKARRPWFRQEVREPAPFMCTYMGRGNAGTPPIRVLWNKSEAIATNTYLLLYPHPSIATAMRNPGTTEELFALLQQTVREAMEPHLRTHADGLHKIEPGDLAQVRFPSVPRWLIDLADQDWFPQDES